MPELGSSCAMDPASLVNQTCLNIGILGLWSSEPYKYKAFAQIQTVTVHSDIIPFFNKFAKKNNDACLTYLDIY